MKNFCFTVNYDENDKSLVVSIENSSDYKYRNIETKEDVIHAIETTINYHLDIKLVNNGDNNG